jgi:thioredoxin 1
MDKSVGVKIAAIAGVVVVAAAAFVARGNRRAEEAGAPAASAAAGGAACPRLVELGSKTCIPCKMMEPVIAELRREFEGRLRVDFIDVKARPEAAAPYGISLIPTQIWFDASGEELARHEGFISKDDIVAVFGEHGVDLGGGAVSETAPARE